MFAGKTLAEIALALEADPTLASAARAELEARIARPNARPGSVKRAQAALARMDAGTSVAIPTRPEKAPRPAKGSNPNTATNARTAQANLRKAAATAQMPEKLAWDFACKALKAGGYPVPRHMSKAARTGTLAPKA